MKKIQQKVFLVSCGFLLLFTTACTEKQTPAGPDVISFTKPALYPEGIEYDTRGKRFLVTSLREGIIGAVTDDGKYSVAINDPELISAIGLRIDAARDRVLV